MNRRELVTSARTASALLAAAVLVTVAAVWPANAQWKPTERITLVTHSGTGSGVDLFLREIARIWEKHGFVDVPVNIQNRTGARGDKARRYVVQQNANNPHLLFGMTPSQVVNAVLKGGEINVRSYTPIAMVAVDPLTMVVHNDSPYKSAKDVMDAARERPGELLLGGGRFGNVPSLVGVLMQRSAGVEITYTPFKGGGQAVLALLGKHVDFILEGPSEINEHVAAGNLRIVGSSLPLKEYPDVKTFEEQGLNFRVLAQYRGVVAPPNIPQEAADFYIDLMEKTIETEDWKSYAKRNELQPFWRPGKEQLQVLTEDEAEYKKLAKELNLMK